jgi:hypothetical protein
MCKVNAHIALMRNTTRNTRIIVELMQVLYFSPYPLQGGKQHNSDALPSVHELFKRPS